MNGVDIVDWVARGMSVHEEWSGKRGMDFGWDGEEDRRTGYDWKRLEQD